LETHCPIITYLQVDYNQPNKKHLEY